MIRELVDTEANYLGVLHGLRDTFMTPMSNLLGEDELNKIFPCIRKLVDIHERFLEKLRDATSKSPTIEISDAVLEVRRPFLLYGEYFSRISNSLETLQGVTRENPDFKALLNVSYL